jgi:hypothetical protein
MKRCEGPGHGNGSLGFSLTPSGSLASLVLVCETLSLLQLFVRGSIFEMAFFVNPDHS